MRKKKHEDEPADEHVEHVEQVAAEPKVEPKPDGSLTITYVGDPRGGPNPDTPVFAGVAMPKGEPVTITDKGWIEKFAFRFRRNRHFQVA